MGAASRFTMMFIALVISCGHDERIICRFSQNADFGQQNSACVCCCGTMATCAHTFRKAIHFGMMVRGPQFAKNNSPDAPDEGDTRARRVCTIIKLPHKEVSLHRVRRRQNLVRLYMCVTCHQLTWVVSDQSDFIKSARTTHEPPHKYNIRKRRVPVRGYRPP